MLSAVMRMSRKTKGSPSKRVAVSCHRQGIVNERARRLKRRGKRSCRRGGRRGGCERRRRG